MLFVPPRQLVKELPVVPGGEDAFPVLEVSVQLSGGVWLTGETLTCCPEGKREAGLLELLYMLGLHRAIMS